MLSLTTVWTYEPHPPSRYFAVAKSKKQWFLIEIMFTDKSSRQFAVEAESYGEACVKANPHVPGGTWKLLGQFEKMETDKNILQRIA